MNYSIQRAKANFSRLIKEAEKGAEIIIMRGKKPVARLVAISDGNKKRVPGRLRGLISWEPNAFAPLTDEELRDWGSCEQFVWS
jgi:prevent-host-death family protein